MIKLDHTIVFFLECVILTEETFAFGKMCAVKYTYTTNLLTDHHHLYTCFHTQKIKQWGITRVCHNSQMFIERCYYYYTALKKI